MTTVCVVLVAQIYFLVMTPFRAVFPRSCSAKLVISRAVVESAAGLES